MHPSPRSLIRVTFTAVCVLTLTAVTAGVSVAQGSSSGSTGSSALSGSSGQGSAIVPGSAEDYPQQSGCHTAPDA